MKSYIVHIYSRDEENGRIMGFVEGTRNTFKKPFDTDQEMLGLLKCGNVRERRRLERLNEYIPVKVTGKNIQEKSFTEETLISDISTGSASFVIENTVSCNTILKMEIYPAGSAAMDISAKVTRIDDVGDKQGIGVIF